MSVFYRPVHLQILFFFLGTGTCKGLSNCQMIFMKTKEKHFHGRNREYNVNCLSIIKLVIGFLLVTVCLTFGFSQGHQRQKIGRQMEHVFFVLGTSP